MAWEYLRTTPFDLRYRVASAALQGQTKDKVIVDLNCGEPGFYRALEKDFKAYYCNDVLPIEMQGDKLHFQQIKDEEVDIEPDILATFGYGGGEFTGQPLESATTGKSIVRLANKYHPEYIIVEMANKWNQDYNALTIISESLINYEVLLMSILNIFPVDHYHNQRLLTIFKYQEN